MSPHASRARFHPHRFPVAPHPRRLPALIVPRPATPPQAGPSPPVDFPLLPYPIKHKTRGALSSSSQLESGGVLPSQAVASLVLSALKGLTAVFGMGTGGSPSPLPPEIVIAILFSFPSRLHNCIMSLYLLSLRFGLRSSPRPISTGQLHALLHFHPRPIYLVVFKGPYSEDGKSYLEGGFTLRCFQRLSRPHFATRPCHWQGNRCTRGASIPVLSY